MKETPASVSPAAQGRAGEDVEKAAICSPRTEASPEANPGKQDLHSQPPEFTVLFFKPRERFVPCICVLFFRTLVQNKLLLPFFR